MTSINNNSWLQYVDISELTRKEGQAYRKLYLNRLLRYIESFSIADFVLYRLALKSGMTESDFADCLEEREARISRGEY